MNFEKWHPNFRCHCDIRQDDNWGDRQTVVPDRQLWSDKAAKRKLCPTEVLITVCVLSGWPEWPPAAPYRKEGFLWCLAHERKRHRDACKLQVQREYRVLSKPRNSVLLSCCLLGARSVWSKQYCRFIFTTECNAVGDGFCEWRLFLHYYVYYCVSNGSTTSHQTTQQCSE